MGVGEGGRDVIQLPDREVFREAEAAAIFANKERSSERSRRTTTFISQSAGHVRDANALVPGWEDVVVGVWETGDGIRVIRQAENESVHGL